MPLLLLFGLLLPLLLFGLLLLPRLVLLPDELTLPLIGLELNPTLPLIFIGLFLSAGLLPLDVSRWASNELPILKDGRYPEGGVVVEACGGLGSLLSLTN